MTTRKSIMFMMGLLVAVGGWMIVSGHQVEARSAPVQWSPCVGAPTTPVRECATVDVPLDYSNPDKGTAPLHIARAQTADPAKRQGTLLVLPGGPPSGGVSFVGYTANLSRSVAPEIQEAYDLVGIQQFGSWDGVPCLSGETLKEYWETNHLPKTTNQLHHVMGLEKTFNEGCVNEANPLVPYMNTQRSIRDIETVRQALGVDTFNLLGFSYGTALAHGYMHQYPQSVGRAVLDSVVDRSQPDPLHDKENIVGFEKSWHAFKEWCQSTNDCSLRGQNLDTLLRNTLDTAATSSIPAPRNPFGAGTLNDWELTVGMQALTGSGEATWVWAATVLQDAANGDGSQGDFSYDLLTGRRPDGTYLGGDGTRRAFSCNDSTWSQIFIKPEVVQTWADFTRLYAPVYGQASVYQGVAQCYKWPLAPASPPPHFEPVPPSNEKALLISADQDASTPLKWAERVQSQIPGSRLVVVSGASHLQLAKSRCAMSHAVNYLVAGTLPADRTPCTYDPDLIPPQLPPHLGLGATGVIPTTLPFLTTPYTRY